MYVEKITIAEIEKYVKLVKDDPKYGSENRLIDAALKKFPENSDKSIVAMKIALIDLTNSTRLFFNLGKENGLDKLAEKITTVDFDKRVKEGNFKIVNELAEWSKNEIGNNLFSFISKYCLYHNVHCYNRDDYVIYDSVMRDNIPKYITNEEYEKVTGKKLYKNSFKKIASEFNYQEYVDIIDYIIQKNTLSDKNIHRKLDWFIWYKYNKKNSTDNN